MKPPPEMDGHALWSRISPESIGRLREYDQQIEATHTALRTQLDTLCVVLAERGSTLDQRLLNRLIVILDHTAHLTRQSVYLIEQRRQLLRAHPIPPETQPDDPPR